ncbi:hypothetical protein [uncultured Bacteroides sp.]|uniref:hypothetical protein n=1 Tax=uncultured Bacteroides sp. TaxID=162156 RepID=UPI002628D37F|nr:hypothetical protein [uncultured Bacteroides sp.]
MQAVLQLPEANRSRPCARLQNEASSARLMTKRRQNSLSAYSIPATFCRNRNMLHKVRINMLRFPMDMHRLCRNRNFPPMDAGVSGERYKCFSRAALTSLVRNINVYRDRH